jgi:hypothetical protein
MDEILSHAITSSGINVEVKLLIAGRNGVTIAVGSHGGGSLYMPGNPYISLAAYTLSDTSECTSTKFL